MSENKEEKNLTPSESADSGKRRRTILPIIDRKFQFKVTLMVVGIITLTHLAVGGFLYKNLSDYSVKISVYVPDLESDIIKFREGMENYLIWTIISTFIAIIILAIYFSSRISGPLFNMSRVMQEVGDGHYHRRVKLRNGDELQEFSEALNRLFSALEDRQGQLEQILDTIEAQAKGNNQTAILDAVQKLAKRIVPLNLKRLR